MMGWSIYFVYFSRYFANSFLSLYTYAVIILIGLVLIKNKFTSESKNWLYVFNTLMAYVSLLNLLYWVVEIFINWYGQNPYELYAFVEYKPGPTAYTWTLYYFLLFPYLMGLFFFYRKSRLRIWFVIIFLIVFNAGTIWYWFLQLGKDYLPSSWSVYYSETFLEKILRWILVPVVIIFTYWILNKRNRLPCSSLFFKSNAQSV